MQQTARPPSAPVKAPRRRRKPAPPPMPPQLVTAGEAAARLSLGVRSLWRLVKQGKITQPIRFTRKLVRFHVEDLDARLQELRRRAAEGGPGHAS